MRRLVFALLGLMLTTGAATAPAQGSEFSAAADQGFQQISQCLQSHNDLAVLLVVDESGSLSVTDPTDKRARLLASLVRSLGRQAGKPTANGERRIDLAISTFAGTYRKFQRWTELNKDSTERIARDVERRIPDLDQADNGTDHRVALSGARNQMAEITASYPAERPPCTVTILFTDGVMTISKDNAANQAATQEMCRKGGVVDGVRRDDINLVTVMLFDRGAEAAQPGYYREGREMLQAAAEGRGGSFTCGTVPIPANDALGAYLEGDVERLASLFATASALSNGSTQVQLTGPQVRFAVDEGIESFSVIAASPEGITLRGPAGQRFGIPVGAAGEQGARAFWDFDTVTVEVPVTDKSIGTWTVSRPGQTDSIGVFLDTGLGIRLRDASLVAGEPAPISGRIVRPGSSSSVDLTVYRTAIMTASLDGNDPVQLSVRPDGSFSGTVEPKGSGSIAQLDVSLNLTTSSGLTLVPISGLFRLPVTLPKEFPTVSPADLALTPLVGRKGNASGTLTVTGSSVGPTQVCLGPVNWTIADDPSIYSTDIPSGCFDLAPDEQRQIPVDVTTSKASDGRVSGNLPLQLTSARGGQLGLDVPVTFTATQPINQAVRLGVVAALSLIGLIVPLVVLLFVNRHLAKFRPPDGIRGLSVPAALATSGFKSRQSAVNAPAHGSFDLAADKLRVIPLPRKAQRAMTGPDGSALRTHVPRSVFGTPTASVGAGPGMRVFSNKAPFLLDQGKAAPVSFGLGDVWYATISDADLAASSAEDGIPATVSVFVPPRGQGDGLQDLKVKLQQFPHFETVLAQLRDFATKDSSHNPAAAAPASEARPRPTGPSVARPAGPVARPSGPNSGPQGPATPSQRPVGPAEAAVRQRPSGPA